MDPPPSTAAFSLTGILDFCPCGFEALKSEVEGAGTKLVISAERRIAQRSYHMRKFELLSDYYTSRLAINNIFFFVPSPVATKFIRSSIIRNTC
uniref:Uncharacterized protein n=1 Tax=Haemonchus placei TaxID=6290 RepID=A0A0N4W149_HAEPC